MQTVYDLYYSKKIWAVMWTRQLLTNQINRMDGSLIAFKGQNNPAPTWQGPSKVYPQLDQSSTS